MRLCDHALHVPALDWWLDTTVPRDVGFIGHAHSDHIASHRRVVCTPETAALLEVWLAGHVPPCRLLAYDHYETHGDARVGVLPSGHILGGAMLHVATPAGSLLYAGDVRRCGSATCEAARPVPADLLIVEDTFGDVDGAFLEPAAASEEIVRLCRRYRSLGRTPVIVTLSNCGKAQDAAASLIAAGMRVALQHRIWCFAEVYRALGRLAAGYDRLAHGRINECDVCIVTEAYLAYRRDGMPAMVRDPAYILLSGWAAVEDDGRYDARVPWSDHASRDDLLRFIEVVRPSEVWTFAGSGSMGAAIAASGLAPQPRFRHLGEMERPGH